MKKDYYSVNILVFYLTLLVGGFIVYSFTKNEGVLYPYIIGGFIIIPIVLFRIVKRNKQIK